MKKVKVHSSFIAPAYNSNDFQVGYNVFVNTPVVEDIITTYGYRGDYEGDSLLPMNQDLAQRLCDRVFDRGTIDPLYWVEVQIRNVNDLPDYVLNPWREEYN